MTDQQLNGQSITTTSATTNPASGTQETWTVTALAAGIPALVDGNTYALVDATAGASAGAVAEIIRVIAAAAGATSITVIRGADDSSTAVHANPAIFNIIAVESFLNAKMGVLAYAENTTTTPTTTTGALTYSMVATCMVVVPPTSRDVYLEWELDATVASAATAGGLVYGAIQETTSGTPALKCSANRGATTANVGTYSSIIGTIQGRRNVGPSSVTRMFNLYLVDLLDTSSTMTASCTNTDTNPSYLRAVS